MITGVDLLRGLAALVGWRRIDVPGATGYLDTDYAAKGRYAVAALDEVDLVCVHVEATDEASHEGNAAAKVKALEEIDRHIVGPLHEALKRRGDYRILVDARPSHAATDQNPRPRLRAVRPGRRRHCPRRGRPLRRSDGRPLAAGVRRRVAADAILLGRALMASNIKPRPLVAPPWRDQRSRLYVFFT